MQREREREREREKGRGRERYLQTERKEYRKGMGNRKRKYIYLFELQTFRIGTIVNIKSLICTLKVFRNLKYYYYNSLVCKQISVPIPIH